MASTRARLIVAFLAVYVIWGSTYLGIRFAIESIPPFIMAGVRFIIAGAILYAWARYRGAPAPSRTHWITAAVVGTLLLIGGNGGVVWAEQRVPSGLTALLIATEPFWIVLMDWLRPGGTRPTGTVVAGLCFGFFGVGLLVSPWDLIGGGRVDPIGAVAIILASLSWAAGSLYTARGARLPSSPMLTTAMEMLIGGVLFLVLATTAGEWTGFAVSSVSFKSLMAVLYLVVFGAIVGFTAYMYILKNSPPAKASTYAYVNPVVAVFLGWLLAHEPVTGRVLLAAAAIISAVVLITRRQGSPEGQSSASRSTGVIQPTPKQREPAAA